MGKNSRLAYSNFRVLFKRIFVCSYPREKTQGIEFEKSISPVDLIISLECAPVINGLNES